MSTLHRCRLCGAQLTHTFVDLGMSPLCESYVPEEYRDHLSLLKEKVPEGKYFVLGDHRSSSNDSRVWGFVDRSEIYGKAVFVYWPLDRMGAVR